MRGIEAVLTVEGDILAKRRYRMKVLCYFWKSSGVFCRPVITTWSFIIYDIPN